MQRRVMGARRQLILWAGLLGCGLGLVGSPGIQAATPEGLPRPEVKDTPADDGSSLTLDWPADLATQGLSRGLAPDALPPLIIERRAAQGDSFEVIGQVPAAQGTFRDTGLERGAAYVYRLAVEDTAGVLARHGPASVPIAPRANLFRGQRLNALVAVILMSILVVSYIMAARRGADLYIRRIAGLDALDEAVGRAAMM